MGVTEFEIEGVADGVGVGEREIDLVAEQVSDGRGDTEIQGVSLGVVEGITS